DKSGKLINLKKYPKAEDYLLSNRDILDKRYVAKKNPLAWYKTIDCIKYGLISKHKIVLPDISGNKFLFIDKGQYYPHHNLYYITGNEEKLVILAAILMSGFVLKQLL